MVSVEKKPRLDSSDTITTPDLSSIHRFVVLRIEKVGQKILLTLHCDKTDRRYKCWLTGQWVTTNVDTGDVVNVRTSVWKNEAFEIGTLTGFIVVNPDNMIPSTTVASSLFCSRKTWLGDKFKGWGGGNKVMTIGIAVHELLQHVCTHKIYERENVTKAMRELITSKTFLHQAYACEMDENEMEEECLRYIPHIMEFLRKYVVGGPSPLHEGSDEKKLKILQVVDIEDNIWCHYFGVKGKVDLSAEVEIHESNKKNRVEVLPLELKTGKTSFSSEHVAQATLYTLMMDERQHGSCSSALLLYLKDGPQMKEIAVNDVTKHSLIQRRNEVEYNSRSWRYGPEFKDSEQFCYKCEHLLDCSLMAKTLDEELIQKSVNMKRIIPNVLAHLKPEHLNFFKDWIKILNSELEEGTKSSQSGQSSQGSQVSGDNNSSQNIGYQRFWNSTASNRESAGLGLSSMKIVNSSGCTYTFSRSTDKKSKSLSDALSKWNRRDRIALSIDGESSLSSQSNRKRDMIAIITGYVDSWDEETITCKFDKELQKSLENEIFRIDQLGTSSYSFNSNFSNLLRLFSPGDETASRLRSIIIDKESAKLTNNLTLDVIINAKKILKQLTKPQKAMIVTVLASKTFSLINYNSSIDLEIKLKIMCCLIEMIHSLKMTVLITAYSNKNLDEILNALNNKELKVVRIGSKSRVEASLAESTDDHLTKDMETVHEISSFYESSKIIGSTIYSLSQHTFFELRKKPFDFCIVDQASSMLLSSSILPLFKSSRFVLFGESDKKPMIRSCNESLPQVPLSLFDQLRTEANTFTIP